jgi:hypothetical protein
LGGRRAQGRREAIRQLAELRRRLAAAEDAFADALAAMKQAEGAFDAASDRFGAAERALDAAREDRANARRDRLAPRCGYCGWYPPDPLFGQVLGRHDPKFVGHAVYCPVSLFAEITTAVAVGDQWHAIEAWARASSAADLPGWDDTWRRMSWGADAARRPAWD